VQPVLEAQQVLKACKVKQVRKDLLDQPVPKGQQVRKV
jgi:hypothetical protein